MKVIFLTDAGKQGYEHPVTGAKMPYRPEERELSSLPLPTIIKDIFKKELESEHYWFPTVTALLGCPRKTAWSQTEDTIKNLTTQLIFWRGTILHEAIEKHAKKYPDKYIVEREFEQEFEQDSATYPLVLMKGKADLIEKNKDGSYSMIDWKTMNWTADLKYKTGATQSNVWQLNIYRYLARNDYPNITKLYACYFPTNNIVLEEVPIFPDEKVHKFIKERLGVLCDALTVAEKGGEMPDVLECQEFVAEMWRGQREKSAGELGKLCKGWRSNPVLCPFYDRCHGTDHQKKTNNLKVEF
jgi:hypothetical protein